MSVAQPKRLVELLTDEGLAFTLGFIYLHVSFILLVTGVFNGLICWSLASPSPLSFFGHAQATRTETTAQHFARRIP